MCGGGGVSTGPREVNANEDGSSVLQPIAGGFREERETGWVTFTLPSIEWN